MMILQDHYTYELDLELGYTSVPIVSHKGIRVMGDRLGGRTVLSLSRRVDRVPSPILSSQCLLQGPPITLFLNIARMQQWFTKGTHKHPKDRCFQGPGGQGSNISQLTPNLGNWLANCM